MSTDAPVPRRGPLAWAGRLAGPVLVSALLVTGVVYQVSHKDDRDDAMGACRGRPETVRAIRAEPVLNQPPRAGPLDEPVEAYSCNTAPPAGDLISFVSNGAVSRRLTTSTSPADVRAYYADLARRSGWTPDDTKAGLYSATKPDGNCPWWFVLSAEKAGFEVSVYYQPIGVPADDCEWASGDPMLIPLTR
ncbi:hypothetical protein [Paractinoplanes globisporus]|uniref:DUF3558 domain-containing protein n=1 Tax=Paractinoplanes globisporus TaxID=113565 RepID=A0ABW6W7Y4_9ACTN|nr:hypothetical protein [Actinoplanes globisporus]